MPIGPITRARAKKLQEAFNGLVKFIWANPTFKEELKSNQVFEGIGTVRYCTVFSFIVLLYCESYIYKSNM